MMLLMQVSLLGMTFSSHDDDFILNGVDLRFWVPNSCLVGSEEHGGEEREEDLCFRLQPFSDRLKELNKTQQ